MLLGNLSLKNVEELFEVKFSEEDKQWLNEHRQEQVDVPLQKDKWHWFLFPRVILVDSIEFASEIYERLKYYPFNEQIRISIQ